MRGVVVAVMLMVLRTACGDELQATLKCLGDYMDSLKDRMVRLC